MTRLRDVNDSPREPTCPICGRAVKPTSPSYPFCTDRCRLVDLGMWFSGGYSISRPLEQRDIEEGQE